MSHTLKSEQPARLSSPKPKNYAGTACKANARITEAFTVFKKTLQRYHVSLLYNLHYEVLAGSAHVRLSKPNFLFLKQVLEMLTLTGYAPAKGGYVWQIESDISMYYWWTHLDVWEANHKVQTCCHNVVTHIG